MKTFGPLLCSFGICLVVTGILQYQQKSPVDESADRYLAALKAGDTDAMQRELSPQLQKLYQYDPPVYFDNAQPDPEIAYSIGRSSVKDDTARVTVSIEKQGYRIRPTLHFKKIDGRWCITETSNLQTDPRWELSRLKREQSEQRALEDEVEHRFKDVAGVSVKTLR